MRNIQFHHKRLLKDTNLQAKGGTTLCLEVPTVEEFDALQPSLKTSVVLKFGAAECSKKDNYNKKLGREISKGRLKDTFFFVTTKSSSEVQLTGAGFTLVLRKYENTVRIYFEEAF